MGFYGLLQDSFSLLYVDNVRTSHVTRVRATKTCFLLHECRLRRPVTKIAVLSYI
jgi:hypothetical protein